jgi:carboxymethylenebutenolidase
MLAPMNPMLAVASLSILLAQDPQKPAAKPAAPPQEPKAGAMSWTGMLDEKEFAALHALKTDAAPKPLGEMVPVGDGKAYLSLPPGGHAPFPAVVVVHEWWGLNDHIKHWADRLAADGYAALAVDLYGGKTATNRDDALKLMQAAGADVPKAVATMRAAFDFLGTDKRVAATKRGVLGWCFGGGMSLQLALAEPKLDACVVYYGTLVTDSKQLAAIPCPLLGIFGNKDTGITPASVDAFEKAMKEAGRECAIHRYDANHAFANPSGANYDQANATKAWAETRAYLAQRLKGAPAPKEAKAPTDAGGKK